MKIHNKLIKSTTVAEKGDLWGNFIITILTRTGLHMHLWVFTTENLPPEILVILTQCSFPW